MLIQSLMNIITISFTPQLSRPQLCLDDGVKHNYAIFHAVLARIK